MGFFRNFQLIFFFMNWIEMHGFIKFHQFINAVWLGNFSYVACVFLSAYLTSAEFYVANLTRFNSRVTTCFNAVTLNREMFGWWNLKSILSRTFLRLIIWLYEPLRWVDSWFVVMHVHGSGFVYISSYLHLRY